MSKQKVASLKPKSKQSLPERNWKLTAFECHLVPRVISVIVLEHTLQTHSWLLALFSLSFFLSGLWLQQEALGLEKSGKFLFSHLVAYYFP